MKKIISASMALFMTVFFGCTTLGNVKAKETEESDETGQKNEATLNDGIISLTDISEDDFVEAMKAIEIARGTPLIERQLVYVETPETVYTQSNSKTGDKILTGKDALKQNLNDQLTAPEYLQGHLKAWVFQPQKIYQIHCQTYHTTVIQLEPGEELMEVPYISEPDVWKISRGTGLVNGMATQYLMLKPDYKSLESTMIIITNKRMYQLQITSYNDHYMPFVQWVYNDSTESKISIQPSSGASTNAAVNRLNEQQNSRFLDSLLNISGNMSFNYTVKCSGTKPYWYPELVFDDGKSTYIVLNPLSLNMEQPAVFKNKDELVNYSTKQNVITVPDLVTQLTLKAGKTKVTIKKEKN